MEYILRKMPKRSVQTIDVYAFVLHAGNEEEMKDALATMGPVTIAYDASQDSMTFYSRCVRWRCFKALISCLAPYLVY